MKLLVPIIGLKKRFGLDDIQPLEILNFDSPGKSILPPLSNVSQKAINILGLIDNIYLTKEKKELHAVYKFPDLNNPEIFQGQEDLESIGLGLIVKIYELSFMKDHKSKFDMVCITGVLKKFPAKNQILTGNFIDNNTGLITEKLRSFMDFLKQNGIQDKKTLFLYSGNEDEAGLRITAESEGLTNLRIINASDFNRVLDEIFLNRKVGSLAGFIMAAALILFLVCIVSVYLYVRNDNKFLSINNKNILTDNLKFKSEGDFLKYFSYDSLKHQLSLPGCKGNINIEIPEINLSKLPYMNFSLKSDTDNNSFFIEIKNIKNQALTDGNIKITVPSTGGKYIKCSLYIYDLAINPINKVNVLTISNPEKSVEVEEITFSRIKPDGSDLLLRIGENSLISKNDTNLVSAVSFRGGGGIDFEQNETLRIKSSKGWIWTVIPETDIKDHHVIYIRAKTSYNVFVFLELKYVAKAVELPIIADETNTDRMSLFFENTKDRFKLFSFDLKIRPDMRDKTVAHILALSGPTGNIEISEIYFK